MKNEQFYSEIGKKGAATNREKRIKVYNANPNYCKQCGKKIEIREGEIPSITKQRVFCSKECKNIHQSIVMSGNKLNQKNKKLFCLNCGAELNKSQKKYCSNKCQAEYQYMTYIQAWKNGEKDGMKGDFQLSQYIEKYIKEKYDYKCCNCGWNEINPYTNKIPLEIHHVDGNYKNNKEENLKLLCPNCHSLTETYKNALNHEGRKGRTKYYKNKQELAS